MSTPYEIRRAFTAALKRAGDEEANLQRAPRFCGWTAVSDAILSDPEMLDAICEYRARQLNTERTVDV